MTAITMVHRREARGTVLTSRSARAALVAAALLCSYGAVATTLVHVGWSFLMAPLWLAIGWMTAAVARGGGVGAVRAAVVLALAHGATMLGVALVRFAVPPGGAVLRHPPFGEHPVRQIAGFPWVGVEGNGSGLGVERIPYSMGVDALLVNLTAWTVVFALLVRFGSAAKIRAWIGATAVLAAVGGLFGGWRLVVLFD